MQSANYVKQQVPRWITPFGVPEEQVCRSRKFDTVDPVEKQAIVLEWRAPPQRFVDHSIDEWRRRLQ